MCAKNGDFSPLCPLSVRDSIWLDAACRKVEDEKTEEKNALFRFSCDAVRHVAESISDMSCMLLDIDSYIRVVASKGTGKKSIELLKTEDLPSMRETKRRKQEEYEKRRASMTDKEREMEDIAAFNSGMKYKP